MIQKKDCVAMLLAGGQGSRLYVLTSKVAKPAIPFGGKYRLIDFPLSNCINSAIDTVGVLTQYQPHELNAYIGSGQPWDLDRLEGGVHVLPPYMRGKGGQWYKGSANAIYQNINFIEHYDPEYVLVLAGDQIYKMDYSKMLAYHIQQKSTCTIAVIDVPMDEASRMGIMNANADGTVYEFEEKPKQPKSTLASMGIYIFNWRTLKKYLIEDEADPKSKNDFGGNIIPNMLNNGERLMVYRFDGYWKDVGTIHSLWEANMDMLASKENSVNLFDPNWRVYARNPTAPPHMVGPNANISHSLVTEGCQVYGNLENAVLFHSVVVEEGAQIRHSIIMPGAHIGRDAVIEYAIIAEDAQIRPGARVGAIFEPPSKPQIAVVAAGITVGTGCKVAAGALVDKDIVDEEAQS
ncbi:MAG: glucose-1-phosphate adenylyltransferase [Oscillospiraceae bacterium]|nr:glucose-1-phosphate adenylyltransferase [Oscillospiraceae bacterium]